MGWTETPSRRPHETRKATKETDTTSGELAALRAGFSWREAAIRLYAPPRERAGLLRALQDERRAAERALLAGKRFEREARRAARRRAFCAPRPPGPQKNAASWHVNMLKLTI